MTAFWRVIIDIVFVQPLSLVFVSTAVHSFLYVHFDANNAHWHEVAVNVDLDKGVKRKTERTRDTKKENVQQQSDVLH